MTKKILGIVLALAMLLSSSLCFASNGTATLDGYEEYKGLFNAMGVMPNVDDSTASMKRSDFILMLADLMNIGIAPQGESPFSDVILTSDLAKALNAAIPLGIVSPGDKFYPDSAITSNQAIKMVVTALGYGEEAIYRGGYPTGYNVVAKNLDIDAPYSDKELSWNDGIYILGQMCETYINDLKSVTKDENGYGYSLTQGDTFLYYYNKIYTVQGVVGATQESYLDDSTDALSPLCVEIGGKVYVLSEGIECPLGYRVTAFVKDDNSLKDTIIYATLNDNKVVTLTPDNEAKMVENKLEYITDDGKEKSLKCDPYRSVLYNGKAFADCVDSDFSIAEGRLELIDNDSDGTYEVISIWSPTYVVVDYVDSINGVIYDENFTNNIFLDNSDIIYTSDVALKNLKSSDVLEIFISKDGKYASIHLLKNRVSGVIDGYTPGDKLVFGDNEYDTTIYFNTYYSNVVSAGMDVTIILNDANQCVSLKSYQSGSIKYGYLDAIKTKSGMDSNAIVKVFSETGEVLTLPMSRKVRIDDEVKTWSEAYGILSAKLGNIIRYRLDSTGNLHTIITEGSELGLYVPSEDGPFPIKRYDFPGYDTTSTMPYKVTGYFVPNFIIDSGTVIFCIAESETDDAKKFNLGNGINFLANDTQVVKNTLYAYNVNEAGRADAIVYKTNSYSATIDERSNSGLVSKFNLTINDEGDPVYKIEMYYADKYSTYYIKSDAPFITDGDNTFVPGDFIRYTVDSLGYVTAVSKDFDYTTKTVLGSTSDNTINHYYYGDVYMLGESSTAIRREDGSIMYIPMAVGDCGYVRDGIVMTSPKDIVKTYKHVGSGCSKILVKCYYSSPQAIYIFD